MRNRGKDNADVPISSLIDVVFLLIMFFVVTSNIEQEVFEVPVTLVKAKNMKPAVKVPPNRVTINVAQERDDKGLFYLGSTPVTPQALRGSLIALKKEKGSGTLVLIRADKDVKFLYESEVIEAIKASGLMKIRIQAELE